MLSFTLTPTGVELSVVGKPEQVVLMESVGIKFDNVQRMICERERDVRCVHDFLRFPSPRSEEREKRYQKCVLTLMNHVRPGSL